MQLIYKLCIDNLEMHQQTLDGLVSDIQNYDKIDPNLSHDW